jgi:hypothetical protein
MVNQLPPPNTDSPYVDVDITELVKQDLDERHATGLKKYGVQLHPFDGRNTLVDAYQEVLDLAQYLRKKIEEDSIARSSNRDEETIDFRRWGDYMEWAERLPDGRGHAKISGVYLPSRTGNTIKLDDLFYVLDTLGYHTTYKKVE